MIGPYVAFVDDSGRGQWPAFVLAGFIATVKQWEDFVDDWFDVLRRDPSLPFLKTKEAAAAYLALINGRPVRGQFRGWSATQVLDRLGALIEVIEAHAIVGIASVIPTQAYVEVFHGKIARGMNSPYAFNFYSIMAAAHRLQLFTGDVNSIDFVFDEQGDQIGRALRCWKYWVQFAPPEIKSMIGNQPASGNEEYILPLQAADLLAWRTRRFIVDMTKGEDLAVRLLPFKSIDVRCDVWDKTRLSDAFNKIRSAADAYGRQFAYDLTGRDRKLAEKFMAREEKNRK